MDTIGKLEQAVFHKRATNKAVIGLCAALGVAALFAFVCNEGYLPKSPLWSIFAMPPFAYCIAGTIESITQRPWGQLANVWKTLVLSKRIMLGVFLFLAAVLVLLLGLASLFHIWLMVRGNAGLFGGHSRSVLHIYTQLFALSV